MDGIVACTRGPQWLSGGHCVSMCPCALMSGGLQLIGQGKAANKKSCPSTPSINRAVNGVSGSWLRVLRGDTSCTGLSVTHTQAECVTNDRQASDS